MRKKSPDSAAGFLGRHCDRTSAVSSWFPTGQVKFAPSELELDAEEVPWDSAAGFLGGHCDRKSSVSSWSPTGQVKSALRELEFDAEAVAELGGWRTPGDVARARVPAPDLP
jgi:hypothetical protein